MKTALALFIIIPCLMFTHHNGKDDVKALYEIVYKVKVRVYDMYRLWS